MEFFRPEYQSGQPFPPLGDIPNPGIKPRSPALQADSLPAEPKGKPKNTGVGNLSLLEWIFPIQESNQGLLHCRRILNHWTTMEAPKAIFFQSYFKNSTWEYKEHIFHVAGCFFLPMMGLTVSGLLQWLSWYRIRLRCRRPGFDSCIRKICRRRDRLPTSAFLGFPFGSAGKESACNAGDLGAVPGLGRSPGEGKGYPLQYSGLEKSMDCIVHGVTKSGTGLHFLSLFNETYQVWYLPCPYFCSPFCICIHVFLMWELAIFPSSLPCNGCFSELITKIQQLHLAVIGMKQLFMLHQSYFLSQEFEI